MIRSSRCISVYLTQRLSYLSRVRPCFVARTISICLTASETHSPSDIAQRILPIINCDHRSLDLEHTYQSSIVDLLLLEHFYHVISTPHPIFFYNYHVGVSTATFTLSNIGSDMSSTHISSYLTDTRAMHCNNP